MSDIMAQFKNGEFVTGTQQTNPTLKSTKEKNSSGMDSDAFLTLLVAEMQNQDPLEPTSNTEWVSQYATFTQVSEIQNIGDKMASVQAQGLVGKQVIMKTTGKDGNEEYIQGKVDFIEYDGGKAYLSINGEKYSIDKLDTVADEAYLDAVDIVKRVHELLKKLPDVDDITIEEHEKTIVELVNICNNVDDYQFSFIEGDLFDTIEEYAKRLAELREAAGLTGGNDEEAAGQEATGEKDLVDKIVDELLSRLGGKLDNGSTENASDSSAAGGSSESGSTESSNAAGSTESAGTAASSAAGGTENSTDAEADASTETGTTETGSTGAVESSTAENSEDSENEQDVEDSDDTDTGTDTE